MCSIYLEMAKCFRVRDKYERPALWLRHANKTISLRRKIIPFSSLYGREKAN